VPWSAHGDSSKLDSLIDERMKGNYHKATDKYIDLLLEVIDKLFESIEELEALVNKLLNEGELVMN
jgi:hypothetical protein